MKTKKYVFGAVLLTTIIMAASCKKWIDDDINKDPNKPGSVTVDLILPAAQAEMAYATGGELRYAACMWMQQLAGGKGKMLSIDRYNYTETDVDLLWTTNLYAGPVMDCYRMIRKSNEEGSPYYGGIARVMMAYLLGSITDMWGDVPFSEACRGDYNLMPAYDPQQVIYDTLNVMLDEAIEAFNMSPGQNFRFPGSDDLIYYGLITKWRKTAYALKARYALHLSKISPGTAYNDALIFLDEAYTSNDDDCQFVFTFWPGGYNPLYQFNETFPGHLVAGAYLVDTLLGTNDPRLPLLVSGDYGYSGSPAGEGLHASAPGNYYASDGSPVPFITYVECKFIDSEARLFSGDSAGAATAFNDAVKASLQKFGVPDPAWEAVYAAETGSTITLEKIIKQKYLALCFQPEVFNDWRRTGFPVLQPASIGSYSEIPRRYPYPVSERLYNGSHVPTVTLLSRIWWDQ